MIFFSRLVQSARQPPLELPLSQQNTYVFSFIFTHLSAYLLSYGFCKVLIIKTRFFDDLCLPYFNKIRNIQRIKYYYIHFRLRLRTYLRACLRVYVDDSGVWPTVKHKGTHKSKESYLQSCYNMYTHLLIYHFKYFFIKILFVVSIKTMKVILQCTNLVKAINIKRINIHELYVSSSEKDVLFCKCTENYSVGNRLMEAALKQNYFISTILIIAFSIYSVIKILL